jgi:hypothetical protein
MIKGSPKQPTQEHNPDVKLDTQYGAIGISAVAAALQFKSEGRNPADLPAAHQSLEERISDKAA